MNQAILVEGLMKTFRGFRKAPVTAVDDISFSIDEGEAFGFIGPNGAGKSTTIKIMTGVLDASAGKIRLFNVPVTQPKARVRVGYVPENPYLYDYLTPTEILLMGMSLHGISVADPRAHCAKWLERLELGAVAKRQIRSFSKGMTQRVAIAHALCLQPRLLILDEPLSGLDPVGRRDVVDILAEYKRDGGTLFFTSHVLHDVERLADRFGLIHQGRLRAVQSPAELAGGTDLVQVRSMGTTPVDGANADFAGRWSTEVTRDSLWKKLDELRAAGHSIIEIRPTLSLESAFMRAIGKE
jgi:ABC-2 type transport system ATP-binding protein